MSASMQLPSHSWASAHRLLLAVLAIALALAVALSITFVASWTTDGETVAPGGRADRNSEPHFPKEPCGGDFCAK